MQGYVLKTLLQPSRWLGPLWILVSALVSLAALLAHAEVNLQNSISKVEVWVDAEGNVQRRLVEATKVVPGDELQYTVRFSNNGTQTVDAGTIVITDAIPEHTRYVDGSAYASSAKIEFSVDGENFAPAAELLQQKNGEPVVAQAQDYAAIRWHFGPELAPGESGQVSFKVRLL